MYRILVAVDGSSRSVRTLEQALSLSRSVTAPSLHIVHACAPFTRHVANLVPAAMRKAEHERRSEAALAPARAMLAGTGLPVEYSWRVGTLAEVVSSVAREVGASQVVLPARAGDLAARAFGSAVEGEIGARTGLPVTVVAQGEGRAWVHRLGVPTSLGLGLTALVMAGD